MPGILIIGMDDHTEMLSDILCNFFNKENFIISPLQQKIFARTNKIISIESKGEPKFTIIRAPEFYESSNKGSLADSFNAYLEKLNPMLGNINAILFLIRVSSGLRSEDIDIFSLWKKLGKPIYLTFIQEDIYSLSNTQGYINEISKIFGSTQSIYPIYYPFEYHIKSIKQFKQFDDSKMLEEMLKVKGIAPLLYDIFNHFPSSYQYQNALWQKIFKEKRELVNVFSDVLQTNQQVLIRKIIENCAKLGAVNFRGETFVHVTARAGKQEALQSLVKEGATVHPKDDKNQTPLHTAAIYGHAHLINFFVKHGLFINEKDSHDQTPLHLAAYHGEKEFAYRLIAEVSADQLHQLLEAVDHHHKTPLHLAVSKGHIDVVELLLIYKANVHAKDKEGNTILHLAIQENRVETINYLLNQKHGPIDVEIPNHTGITPLMLVANRGSTQIITILCRQGINLEATDMQQQTALQHVLLNPKLTATQRLTVFECLVNFGANFAVKNNLGKTVLEEAELLGYKEIAGYIHNTILKKGKILFSHVKKPKIQNLIFEGGSIKGIAYLGALKKLTEDDRYAVKLNDIERVGGTSAGAITAILLGVGYSLESIEDLLTKFDFKNLLDGDHQKNFFDVKDLLQNGFTLNAILNQILQNPFKTLSSILGKFQSDYGLFEGQFFRDWIDERITEQTGKKNTTFGELAQLKEENRKPTKNPKGKFKYVYFVGTNIVTGQSEIFSHENKLLKDMVIADAVRISMSIPFLFVPHARWFKKNDGQLEKDTNGHFYIDGGVSNNYPIWLFDQSQYLSDNPPDAKNVPIRLNRETLGFRLVNWEKKQHYEQKTTLPTKDINGFISFILAIVNCYTHKQESDHQQSPDAIRTIYIDILDVSMLDFDLKPHMRRALMNAGHVAVEDYFRRVTQLDDKPQLSRPLLSALVAGFKEFSLTMGENGLEIKHIRIQEQNPQLIYEFYRLGSHEEIAVLNRLGIQIMTRDSVGNTVLHLAVQAGDQKCIEKLLKTDIKLDTVNQQNESVLDKALKCENKRARNKIVEILIKAGVKICQQPEIVKSVCENILTVLEDENLEIGLKKFLDYHASLEKTFHPRLSTIVSSPLPIIFNSPKEEKIVEIVETVQQSHLIEKSSDSIEKKFN